MDMGRALLYLLHLATTSAAFSSSGGCAATCYEGTCDYWDGGYWGSCERLEQGYDCDCSGCACDGCPQSDCADPKFDVEKCPHAGNGKCDAPKENTEECAWDGGDCCEESCIGTLCGSEGYRCLDPAPVRPDLSDDGVSEDSVTVTGATTGDKPLNPLPYVAGFLVVVAAVKAAVHYRLRHRVSAEKNADVESPKAEDLAWGSAAPDDGWKDAIDDDNASTATPNSIASGKLEDVALDKASTSELQAS
jgi:hypothetical protein